jgi:cell division protein FtsB
MEGAGAMAKMGNIFLISALVVLGFTNAKLVSSILLSKGEVRKLSSRLNYLSERHSEAENQFALKQDHMSKMLTDSDFVERVVREKEGYIKQKEMVFKFED